MDASWRLQPLMVVFIVRPNDNIVDGSERRTTAGGRPGATPPHLRPLAPATNPVEPIRAHLYNRIARPRNTENWTCNRNTMSVLNWNTCSQ